MSALELFKECDIDESGFIDKNELSRICTDLSSEELTVVFDKLDSDGDGKITITEFNVGFLEISGQLLDISRNKRRLRSESVAIQDEYLGSLDESLRSLSCQEHICEMYQSLSTTDNPAIIQQFESIILGVVKDIQNYKMENERLVNSFQREKEHHGKHLAQLEQEMENQVKNVEASTRNEVKNEADHDHNMVRANMEDEILELKENLKRLQQLETMFDKESINTSEYDKMRGRADDMLVENRQLKTELNSAHTTLALVKSELVGLKQQYRDKMQELHVEKDSVNDYIKEQDNLTRQLHLLHDANRRLHDKNDDLLSALETSRTPPRTSPCGEAPEIQIRKVSGGSGPSLGDELSGVASPLVYIQPKVVSYPEDDVEVESMGEDLDSGMSTLRDYTELDNDVDSVLKMLSPTKRHRRRRQRRSRNTYNSDNELADDDSDDDLDFRDTRSDRTDYMMKSHSRPGSACSGSGRSVRSIERMDSIGSGTSMVRRKLPTPPHKVIVSEPERMYKVVLAGDAAVGKSSFIMRLCKDKFVSNLSSTLGVDFQTKVIDVDGRNIALQLWDTAGQERFRSIAKSYFRRADGVLLLYDVTYERSFLNVREWIEAIQESSQKTVPIMFCGNKSDLRDDAKAEGRKIVSYQDGQRLSREYNSLFIETSAKEGDNISEAVVELGRLLRTNEDIEVQTVGLQLKEIQETDKKSKCCG